MKFFLLVLLFSVGQAKEYCLIVSSNKSVTAGAKALFYKRLPGGHIKKDGKYYIFVSKRYVKYNEALHTLRKIKKYYKGAFMVPCSQATKKRTLKNIKVEKNKVKKQEKVCKKEYCLIVSSNKSVTAGAKALFYKRLPGGHIKKDGKYYVFVSKHYAKYNEALHTLRKIKKYYKGAFMVPCSQATKKRTVKKLKKFPKKSKPLVYTSKVVKPLKKQLHGSKKIKNKKPIIKEPEILQKYQIPNINKGLKNNKYDILSFKKYLATLFEDNENAAEFFYQKKIDYLLNDIKKDKYGFDIFLNAYARTGSYISTQQTNLPTTQPGRFDESGVGVSMNVNKLLYDGEYKLINNQYDILNKRLANIKALNAKEKLAILGINIYSNLFFSQERLKLFKEIYEKQLIMQKSIQKAYNLGATSTLNYIDSKNDLLNLKKAVLVVTYEHLHNEYILRHSIKSKSEKKYSLLQEQINFAFDSLSDLQKQAIQNSSDVALQSNKLKINQTDFLAQKRRYYPTVNFNSHLGYGAANDALFFKNFNNTGFSSYWELGLSVNIPLYNRGDILLNKEKELNNILRQKNVLSLKTREILIEVERAYHSLQMIKQQQGILQEQETLLYKKIELAVKLYNAGAVPYRDYSDAMKNYLEAKSQVIDLKQQYVKEMFLLATLIGKRDLYGQN